jgi:hypothetical protein
LLVNTTISLALNFTLSLLWLMTWMLRKLIVLLRNIVQRALNALFTLCPWVVALKGITSPFSKLQKLLWRKDTDLPQDSTLPYSEMPGELDKNVVYLRGVHTEEHFEKVRKQL